MGVLPRPPPIPQTKGIKFFLSDIDFLTSSLMAWEPKYMTGCYLIWATISLSDLLGAQKNLHPVIALKRKLNSQTKEMTTIPRCDLNLHTQVMSQF